LALGIAGSSSALLGSALIAWGSGLRHAVDADHIAAIDNVTGGRWSLIGYVGLPVSGHG
jgi:high-affinity nickel permease